MNYTDWNTEEEKWVNARYVIEYKISMQDADGNPMTPFMELNYRDQNYASMLIAHNGALEVAQKIGEGWGGAASDQNARMAYEALKAAAPK